MTGIQFLLEWALRSAILIVSSALLLRLLRVKAASTRLAAWTAVLCGSLAMPALTLALPQVRLAMIPSVAAHATLRAAESKAGDDEIPVMPATTALLQKADALKPASGTPRSVDWVRVGVMIYALIAAELLARLCTGLLLSMRLLRGSGSTGMATAGIEIRESAGVSSPVALGVIHSAIVLPSDWPEWEATKLEAVLAHERSHIRRRDPAVQLLSAFQRALLWHSPLSWFLHRRIIRVAEEASDDAAVTATGDPVCYARTLLDFMQRGVRGTTLQGVAMARYGLPEERINRILDGKAVSRGVTRWSIAAILALGSPVAYFVAAAEPQSTFQDPALPPNSRPVSVPATGASVLFAQTAAPPPRPAPESTPQQRTTGPRTAEKPLVFDVASVKFAIVPEGVTLNGSMVMARRGVPIPRDSGGPGTNDPGRIHYPLVSLKDLLGRAYDSYFEIAGPGWLDAQIVQVDATMPQNTTKEQFREMLRNLIVDRFGMKYHSENKQVPGYALGVAKGGPKMKESADTTAAQEPDGGDLIGRSGGRGADGFPLHSPLASGRPGINFFFTAQGRRRVYAQQQTVREFADSLAVQLQQDAGGPAGPRVIVTDATNLTAKYDFELTYARDGTPDAESLPSVFSALQSQLGLKLESKKVPVDVMVIDHMEKTPTAN